MDMSKEERFVAYLEYKGGEISPAEMLGAIHHLYDPIFGMSGYMGSENPFTELENLGIQVYWYPYGSEDEDIPSRNFVIKDINSSRTKLVSDEEYAFAVRDNRSREILLGY